MWRAVSYLCTAEVSGHPTEAGSPTHTRTPQRLTRDLPQSMK